MQGGELFDRICNAGCYTEQTAKVDSHREGLKNPSRLMFQYTIVALFCNVCKCVLGQLISVFYVPFCFCWPRQDMCLPILKVRKPFYYAHDFS